MSQTKPGSNNRGPAVFSLEKTAVAFWETMSNRGPGQRMWFQQKEDTEGWDETDLQGKDAAKCDGSFEETSH